MSGLRRFATDEHRQTSVNYWKSMDRRRREVTPVGRILTGLAVTTGIVLLAILGYVLNGWSWLDSLYMVVITISGVGYGEIHPVNTPVLQWMTIGLIVCGYLAAIYTVGGFAQLLIDGELRRILGVKRMQKEIDGLNQHVVICGFGRMGSALAEALATRGRALVVIDSDPDCVQRARACGCLTIQGNAAEESTLKAAGVERASILTTVLSDDVVNLFITITAHDLNPELQILARAEQTSTIKKLRQVGADHVILPANIGADRLANMILRPSAETLLRDAELPEGLNQDLLSLGLRLDELEVQSGSSLIGGTIGDLQIQGENNTFLIVGLRSAAGEVDLSPAENHPLDEGDCVIILAHESGIAQLCSRYTLHSELKEEDTRHSEGIELHDQSTRDQSTRDQFKT